MNIGSLGYLVKKDSRINGATLYKNLIQASKSIKRSSNFFNEPILNRMESVQKEETKKKCLTRMVVNDNDDD